MFEIDTGTVSTKELLDDLAEIEKTINEHRGLLEQAKGLEVDFLKLGVNYWINLHSVLSREVNARQALANYMWFIYNSYKRGI